MLEKNLFVVKEKGKLFSSRQSFEILDENGAVIGTAEQKTGTLAKLLGMVLGDPPTQIDFRSKPGDELVFTIRRKGYFLKKVLAEDAQGQVVGRYKAKMLSLAGGFQVYDKDGKHVAEIRGKFFKSDYTFFTPDGKTEMGKVGKKWGGMSRELFSSAGTYGVQIAPAFADDRTAKTLILGASVALHCLMGKKKGKGGGKDDEGGGDEE